MWFSIVMLVYQKVSSFIPSIHSFFKRFFHPVIESVRQSFINSFIQILWFMYIYNYIHKPASNHLFAERNLIWVLPSRQPWIQQPLLINDGFSGFPQIVILEFSNSTCFIEQCHKMMPQSSKMLQVGLYIFITFINYIDLSFIDPYIQQLL